MKKYSSILNFKLIVFICTFLCSLTSFADIIVAPSVIEITKDKTTQDVIVLNPNKQTAYLQITSSKVEQPGTPQEKRVQVKNPAELGLLVSPNKLILQPGEKRYVRLVLTQPISTVERIYRLTVTPKVSNLVMTNTDAKDAQAQNKQLGLKVIISYGLLIIVRPEHPTQNVAVSRKGNTITISNSGNANVFLMKGQLCTTPDKCTDIDGRRLYAGNTWVFTVPHAGTVKFLKYFMGQSEPLVIP